MAEKVTTMVLKVDLQCPCCYKKMKKVISKFPQMKLSFCVMCLGTREIRDQAYDEKQNTVTITVVGCCPEKIRDKLCCKGGKTIKSIEIKEPPKSKEPEKKKEPKKPKSNGKAKENGKADEPKSNDKSKKPAEPAAGYPPVFPVEVCWRPCYEPCAGGPCYHGHGRPVPWYNNCGYGSYGYCGSNSRGCYVSRCDYIAVENPSACTIS